MPETYIPNTQTSVEHEKADDTVTTSSSLLGREVHYIFNHDV